MSARTGVGPMLDARSMGRLLAWAWLVVLAWAPPAAGGTEPPGLEPAGHNSRDGYFTWIDQDGRTITRTGIAPAPGDTYITEDNRLFEAVDVEDDGTVWAEFVEEVELPQTTAVVPESGWNGLAAVLGAFGYGRTGAAAPVRDGDGNRGRIGIYHSHNAESYIPDSGDEFEEPDGAILDVGRALAEALEEQGYEVIWSDNNHLPHDGGAYQRSRATVRQLIEQGAVALIDVHRDAIPAEEYRTEVNGQNMTKVRLVVGRQNPNREANLELAKRIKAIGDEQYPGLIKGIFNARGNYNQDIGPRTILMEFGTHETSLEEAVRASQLVAEIYPAAAGLAPGTGRTAGRQIGGSAARTAVWVVVIAAAAVFGYLWINEGTPQAAWARLRRFFRRESGALGPVRDGNRSDEG
ncbi:MAG: stage II sporulation protein P [Firmicutes bacterium]|nr:stage II sporulation protein P [Bacillota bacterium]